MDRNGLAFAAIYPAAIGAAHLARMHGPTIARYGRQAWNAIGATAGRYADKIAGAADFVEGYLIDGPPPNSRSGYAGAAVSSAQSMWENDTVKKTWEDSTEKLDKVMDDNASKIKNFWDDSKLLIP